MFVIGTSLYICTSALPFGYFFSLLLTKKATMFIFVCRHTHSDWQSTEAFLFVIVKSNIMLTWKYIGVRKISNIFTIYILYKYLPKSTHENVQSCPYNETREYVRRQHQLVMNKLLYSD